VLAGETFRVRLSLTLPKGSQEPALVQAAEK
jgi:hypothetical protein